MLERLIDLGSLPALVLALLVAGFGVPIPEDVVLLAGGVFAHRSNVDWWWVLGTVYLSAILADCILFAVVRIWGEAWLGHAPLRWLVTTKRRERVRRLLSRHGARAVFIGRHLGGLRAVVFALAALEGVRFRVFVLYDALAGLLTVPFVFALGYLGSSHASAVARGLASAEHWLLVVAACGAGLAWLLWRRRQGKPEDVAG